MIPLVDLKAQYYSIRAEIDEAIARVMQSGQFILGEEVAAFEVELARYCQVRHAIGVNSGTSALHLALLAAGVGPGDEVITVPFTFAATVAAILYCGARPILVDIDAQSLTLNASQLQGAITPRTRAILPVHLYGHPAHMDPILEIARRYGVIVIEDAAQAHGAEYHGRRAGGIGALGCFSFYPSKNLGACGEGGAVTTNDPTLARKIRMLRDWGTQQKDHHELKGFNYRLEEIQAAILRAKLTHLEAWTAARRAHAERYNELLRDSGLQTPVAMPYARPVYHIYAVRTPSRDALRHKLHLAGIQTGIHYPTPVHLQPAYADLGYGPGDFPCAEQAAREVLSLPIYAELDPNQVAEIARVASSAERPSSPHLPPSDGEPGPQNA